MRNGAISKTKAMGITYFTAVENKPQANTAAWVLYCPNCVAISTHIAGWSLMLKRSAGLIHYYIRATSYLANQVLPD